jgi:hypothetical protein
MHGTGWVILIGAAIAGYALWLYDKGSVTGSGAGLTTNVTPANALQTVVTAQGSCAADANGNYTCMTDPDADPQGGNQVTPQTQTEAAYNAGTTTGNADAVTVGANSQQSDYDSYDDPSELD